MSITRNEIGERVTGAELNAVMEFDHVIEVLPGTLAEVFVQILSHQSSATVGTLGNLIDGYRTDRERRQAEQCLRDATAEREPRQHDLVARKPDLLGRLGETFGLLVVGLEFLEVVAGRKDVAVALQHEDLGGGGRTFSFS